MKGKKTSRSQRARTREEQDVKVHQPSLSRYLSSDVVQIDVPGKTYRVHQDLLVERSLYFKSMHNAGFLKPSKPVKLNWRSDVAFGDAFDSILEFMYTLDFDEGQTQDKCVRAAHVYILANYLQMDDLQDYALIKFRGELVEEAWKADRWDEDDFSSAPKTFPLSPQVVVALHRVLYESPFDTDLDAAVEADASVVEADKSPEEPEEEGALSQQQTKTEEIAAVGDHKDHKIVFTDPRNAARQAFTECVGHNLQRLLAEESCYEMFYSGGDFTMDLLAFKVREVR